MARLATALTGWICVLVLQTGCTFVISGSAMDGRVIDSETGAPIAGALVIAEWSGDIGGPVHSKSVCVHMEVATTDPDGRYHIPGWSRRPIADWEAGFFGLRNVETSRRTYKAGYIHLKYDLHNQSNILMTRFVGPTSARVEYLSHAGTPGCGREDGSLVKEVQLWHAICNEVRNLEGAGTSFLHQIDSHIASSLSGSSQQKYEPSRTIPTTCSNG